MLGCSVFAGWAVFEMVLSKTVVFASIVTQKNIAFFAVPHSLMSLLFVIVAVVAATTFLSSSNRKMSLAEASCSRSVTRTAWSLSAGVAADQFLCQSYPKLLYRFVWKIGEVTAKNETVTTKSNINQNMYL